MAYLPTLTMKIDQMWVNTPDIDYMGMKITFSRNTDSKKLGEICDGRSNSILGNPKNPLKKTYSPNGGEKNGGFTNRIWADFMEIHPELLNFFQASWGSGFPYFFTTFWGDQMAGKVARNCNCDNPCNNQMPLPLKFPVLRRGVPRNAKPSLQLPVAPISAKSRKVLENLHLFAISLVKIHPFFAYDLKSSN